MGRNRVPTKQLAARGSWRANARKGEAVAAGVPTCPTWLTIAEKRMFARILSLLTAQGTVAEIDTNAMAAYCRSWTTWREADELARNTEAGSMERARLRAEANAGMATCIKLGGKLGMTPVDRAGLEATPLAAVDDPKLKYFEETG